MRHLLGLLLLLTVSLASAAPESLPPNILILMAEDMSARVGAFGDTVARTPNLDALAADSVRFPNTFTAAGVCAPSRAAFITGVHQISLGAQHMRTSSSPVANYLAVPPAEVKAFPELLRAAGYYTFTDRKLDYQFSGIGAGTGPFTIWDAEGVANGLPELPSDRPFFGLINFFITHESAAFTPASQAPGSFGLATAIRAETARGGLPHPIPADDVAVPPYYPDLPQVREHIADVYNNIQVMDAQVGLILSSLEARGLLDRTIVIWTTDHGTLLPRGKRDLFDSGIQVPMIIRWPAAMQPGHWKPGDLDERLISFVDLAPIVLGMAGVAQPDYLQGRDTINPDVPARRYIHASRDRIDERDDRVRAVRDHRYKYLRYYLPGTPGAAHLSYRDQGRIMQALWSGLEQETLTGTQLLWFQPRDREALYDLALDPHELVNLVDDPGYTSHLNRLRDAYTTWRSRVPDLSDEPEAAMAARFWPDGLQPETHPPEVTFLADGKLVLTADPGASIGYRIDQGAWQLFSGDPITLDSGSTLSAKAVRYGYAESVEYTLSPAVN